MSGIEIHTFPVDWNDFRVESLMLACISHLKTHSTIAQKQSIDYKKKQQQIEFVDLLSIFTSQIVAMNYCEKKSAPALYIDIHT